MTDNLFPIYRSTTLFNKDRKNTSTDESNIVCMKNITFSSSFEQMMSTVNYSITH